MSLHYRGNQAVITQRLPLPHAVVSNWQGETNKNLIGQLYRGHWAGQFPDGPLTIVNRLAEPGVLDNGARFSVFNGLFRRTEPPRYDSSTHLSANVESMQNFIWGPLGVYPDYHHRSPNESSFIVAGPWPPLEYVNYRPHEYGALLEGDLFAAITQRQRDSSDADADFMITSNAEVTKARWRAVLLRRLSKKRLLPPVPAGSEG